MGAEGRVYLGCSVERTVSVLSGGQQATVITYNMEKFLHSCVARYLELAHLDNVPNFPTPFLPEDQKESPAAMPRSTGKVVECPWCCNTFEPTVYPNIASLDAAKRKQPASKKGTIASEEAGSKQAGGGRLQPIAARVLMKVLWTARFARFDLLRAVGYLATQVTTWTSRNDRQLHRLIGYMQSTSHLRMMGWIGGLPESTSICGCGLRWMHCDISIDIGGPPGTARPVNLFPDRRLFQEAGVFQPFDP